jgi:putative endonuclease
MIGVGQGDRHRPVVIRAWRPAITPRTAAYRSSRAGRSSARRLSVILSAAKDLPSPRRRPVKQYYVYIMTNWSRTLYIGLTGDLARRVYAHKHKLLPGFTSKYNITHLVYYEVTDDVRAAIAREKQLKGWLRAKKVALIEALNPAWDDLSAGW